MTYSEKYFFYKVHKEIFFCV